MSSGPDQHADLDRSLVSGIAWTAAAKYGAQIIQWALTLIIARILLPEDYGLFGIAWIAVGFILLINEGGLGLTVVSLRELTKEQIAQLNHGALREGRGFDGVDHAARNGDLRTLGPGAGPDGQTAHRAKRRQGLTPETETVDIQ